MINDKGLPFTYLDPRCIAFPWGIQIVCRGMSCMYRVDCDKKSGAGMHSVD